MLFLTHAVAHLEGGGLLGPRQLLDHPQLVGRVVGRGRQCLRPVRRERLRPYCSGDQ